MSQRESPAKWIGDEYPGLRDKIYAATTPDALCALAEECEVNALRLVGEAEILRWAATALQRRGETS